MEAVTSTRPVVDKFGEGSTSPTGSMTMTNPPIRPASSREDTPSSASSHSLDTALHRAASSTSGEASSGSSLGQSSQETRKEEDMEKFLKKMDMEKKMQALQQRLELASVKASHGWTGMTIHEIETQRLAPISTPRSPNPTRPNLLKEPMSPIRSPGGGYEPPSPSRPWQLIDVLWQPLPPPSGGKYPNSPLSPSSPRKRSRDQLEQLPHRSIFQQQQAMPRPSTFGPMNGHRRSSSSTLRPASPLRPFKEGEKKKRSYSHSTQSTTRQDVDAAKALTFMLGSGSPIQASRADDEGRSRTAMSPRRVKSNTPPKSTGPKNEDKDAADLMLFLAHSPSPVTRVKPSPSRLNEVRGTARVLFQDSDGDKPKEMRAHSNLASAPPITNALEEGF